MTFSWEFPYASRRSPVMAANAVATSQPLAAQAGLEMLRRGGNIFRNGKMRQKLFNFRLAHFIRMTHIVKMYIFFKGLEKFRAKKVVLNF